MNVEWLVAIVIMMLALGVAMTTMLTPEEYSTGEIIDQRMGNYIQLKNMCSQWRTYIDSCSGEGYCQCDSCRRTFYSQVFGFYKIPVYTKASGISEDYSDLCEGGCPVAKECADAFWTLTGQSEATADEDDIMNAPSNSQRITQNFNDHKGEMQDNAIEQKCAQICLVIFERADDCSESVEKCAISSARLP